jgi:sucrose-6-phosphate hydrolase SacC (GH32 family)
MKRYFNHSASVLLLGASAAVLSLSPGATGQTGFPLYNEPYRPQYHFSPAMLASLHQKTLFNGSRMVSPGSPLTISSQGNSSFEFETTVVGGDAGRLDINIRNAAGEQVTVGVDWDNNGQVYVERGKTNGFSNRYFTNDFSTQESNPDNSITLHVLVDRSVLEVFVDDGIQVCTTSFFMAQGTPTEMQWQATNSPVLVQDLEA